MTVVDLDALDKLRDRLEPVIAGTLAVYGNQPWAATKAVLALAPVQDLIAEACKYRALREAVEGLADILADLRAVVATVDGEQ